MISDSERWHGTLSEECVVATEAGSTQHVGALPQQQIFEMEGSVTLTPSERSYRPPLAPLVEAGTSKCATEQDLAISPLPAIILHHHIKLLGTCAYVLPNSLHLCLPVAACAVIEQCDEIKNLPSSFPLAIPRVFWCIQPYICDSITRRLASSSGSIWKAIGFSSIIPMTMTRCLRSIITTHPILRMSDYLGSLFSAQLFLEPCCTGARDRLFNSW